MADADILVLMMTLIVAIGGGLAIVVVTRKAWKQVLQAHKDRPALLRKNLRRIDAYIRDVDQASSDEELDRLEDNQGKEGR